jgi:hypothetical protein
MIAEGRTRRLPCPLLAAVVSLAGAQLSAPLVHAEPGSGSGHSSDADSTPTIPVGLDVYRQWDRWPCQRIGARTYMRSTYDRRGGNEGADASHFLYQEREDFNVALDVEGPGVLYFVRTNHWHGSPWHYEIDGVDTVVQESTTKDPTQKLPDSVFIPTEPFPNPLTWTYSVTKGADLNWVPMPFERRLRLAYSRTHYGTGYYIYHQFVPGANLSQPIRSWRPAPPDGDVLQLLRSAGTDIARKVDASQKAEDSVKENSGELTLPARGTVAFDAYAGEPVMFRAIKLSAPRKNAIRFGRVRLRVTWDNRAEPSIDAPLGLFFGAGTLENRDEKEFLVKALPASIRFASDRVELACYFPMPAFRSARFELASQDDEDMTDVSWSIRRERYTQPANHVGYFHATYRDHGANPTKGQDLVFLDTRGVEGSDHWSGSFVGTSFIFSDRADLTTLEGDPRFFFDGSQTPQCYGTGTEEWGGGGDYWGGLNMTLPLAGHPVGVREAKDAKNSEQLIQSAYRFLLADLMPFGDRAVIRFEHGGENQSTEHYRSVAYWYGLPSPSLVLTDQLDVGDPASERLHRYVSPQGSEPYELTSRYEWGIDHLADGAEVYPAHAETFRKTTGATEFELNLRPDNQGVLLRRTLDYGFANQRAKVFVSQAGQGNRQWTPAGVWYTAGSNTSYYSNPDAKHGGELGRSNPVVQTSNRRFRDDEFLLPRNLTRGRSRIAVKVEFTPGATPLLPDRPIGEQAWTESRYQAYCWKLPDNP